MDHKKRINIFLWMVRKDNYGVILVYGIKYHHQFYRPLDVRSGRVARKLGILKRKQNDNKAVIELDNSLRIFDPKIL